MKTPVNRVQAQWMGSSFATDPDLTLPARPKLIEELKVLPIHDDGLLFAGSQQMQVIRGRSARTLLPRVLPSLDGSRTIAQLTDAFPSLPAKHLRDIVSLLHSRGLLEDGASPLDDTAPSDVASFLGRYIDVTRANVNRAQALGRLQRGRVTVTGDADALVGFRELLNEAGLSVLGDQDAADARTLHVSLVTNGASNELQQLKQAYERGQRCFVVRLGANEAHLGPFLIANTTASGCPGCLGLVHPAPAGTPQPLFRDYALALAATLVTLAVCRVTSGLAPLTFKTIRRDADGLTEELRLAPRLPGCAACGIGGEPIEPSDPRMLAWAYHSSTAFQSKDELNPKDHQIHYMVANLDLASEARRPLYGASRHILPTPQCLEATPDWGSLGGAEPRTETTLDVLATLLARTAGSVLDGQSRRRIAPTGGNLGSVELWVCARRVTGLAPGVYRYFDQDHALEQVQAVDDAHLGDLVVLGPDALESDFVLVGTGAIAKCARKYNTFAYRLVHLDSGVALAHAHRVADALDISLREARDFDDEGVARLLHVGNKREHPAPTFVAFVSRKAPQRAPESSSAPIVSLPPLTSAAYSLAVMDALRQASSVRDRSGVTFSGALPTSAAPSAATADAQLVRSALDEVLFARRAVREYGPAPIGLAALRRLIHHGLRFLQDRAIRGADTAVFIRPLLAVARGENSIDQGLYEFDIATNGLVRIAPFSPQAMAGAVNQDSFAASPCAVFAVGNLRAALALRGVRGYRELVQDAGSLVGHLWLEATALGLVGSAAGGVISAGLHTSGGLNGFDQCPLLGFHFGRPMNHSR